MGETPGLACRSYTHARRYPWIIGKVGGWQLPTQLTVAQLAAWGTSMFVLVQTRRLWAHLPRMLNLLVEMALPVGAAWAARHVRMEGRPPLRALAGLLSYLLMPRTGRVQGRAYRGPRPRRVSARLLVARSAPSVAPDRRPSR